MMYHDEHDKKALNALAADMGLHEPANVDAALGLPLVMLGSDATARLNAITENGTKPGQVPSRKDAASHLNGAALEHARGYHLWSDSDGRQWEWRTLNGSHWWSPCEQAWRKNYAAQTGSFWDRADAMANRPQCPPPGFLAENVIDAKRRAAIAYSKLLRTLTTQAQKDAACDYMAVELEVMDLLEGGAK